MMSDLPASHDLKPLTASCARRVQAGARFARRLRSRLLRGGCALAVGCLLPGCSRSDPDRLQGYLEGEFVYVASPFAGTLEQLPAQRGAQVKSGDRHAAFPCRFDAHFDIVANVKTACQFVIDNWRGLATIFAMLKIASS